MTFSGTGVGVDSIFREYGSGAGVAPDGTREDSGVLSMFADDAVGAAASTSDFTGGSGDTAPCEETGSGG